MCECVRVGEWGFVWFSYYSIDKVKCEGERGRRVCRSPVEKDKPQLKMGKLAFEIWQAEKLDFRSLPNFKVD